MENILKICYLAKLRTNFIFINVGNFLLSPYFKIDKHNSKGNSHSGVNNLRKIIKIVNSLHKIVEENNLHKTVNILHKIVNSLHKNNLNIIVNNLHKIVEENKMKRRNLHI